MELPPRTVRRAGLHALALRPSFPVPCAREIRLAHPRRMRRLAFEIRAANEFARAEVERPARLHPGPRREARLPDRGEALRGQLQARLRRSRGVPLLLRARNAV